MTTSVTALNTTIDRLVQANHILARKNIVDAFGHVSVRHPDNQDRFLLSRSMAPALVSSDNIMTLDLSGEPCEKDNRKPFLERFIHAEIYAARADVLAVVHSHSPSLIPFGASTAPLRPVSHMAGFILNQAPVFEIRDVAGEASDMLVRTRTLGAALAQRLGSSAVILMRGHGATIVGRDLREAVFRAIYLEVNAKIQSEAMRFGSVSYLNAAEAANVDAVNVGQIDRAWDLWCREIGPDYSKSLMGFV